MSARQPGFIASAQMREGAAGMEAELGFAVAEG